MGSFGFANGQPFSSGTEPPIGNVVQPLSWQEVMENANKLIAEIDKREIAQAEKTIVCATAAPIPRPLQGSFLGGLAIAYIGVVVLVALIPFSHLVLFVIGIMIIMIGGQVIDACAPEPAELAAPKIAASKTVSVVAAPTSAAPTSAAPTSAAPKLAAASILAAASTLAASAALAAKISDQRGPSTSQPAWQVGTRPVRHMQPSIIVPIDVYSGLYRQKRGQKKVLDKKHTSQKSEIPNPQLVPEHTFSSDKTESARNHLAGVADQSQQESTKAKQAKVCPPPTIPEPTQPISVTDRQASKPPPHSPTEPMHQNPAHIGFLEKQWPSSALTQFWSPYVITGNVAERWPDHFAAHPLQNFLVPSNSYATGDYYGTSISDVFMDIDTESFGNPSSMDVELEDTELRYISAVKMEDVEFGYTTDIMMDNFEFGCITDIEMDNFEFRYIADVEMEDAEFGYATDIEMEDTELRYLSAVKMEDIGFRYIADVEMEDAEFKCITDVKMKDTKFG